MNAIHSRLVRPAPPRRSFSQEAPTQCPTHKPYSVVPLFRSLNHSGHLLASPFQMRFGTGIILVNPFVSLFPMKQSPERCCSSLWSFVSHTSRYTLGCANTCMWNREQ